MDFHPICISHKCHWSRILNVVGSKSATTVIINGESCRALLDTGTEDLTVVLSVRAANGFLLSYIDVSEIEVTSQNTYQAMIH